MQEEAKIHSDMTEIAPGVHALSNFLYDNNDYNGDGDSYDNQFPTGAKPTIEKSSMPVQLAILLTKEQSRSVANLLKLGFVELGTFDYAGRLGLYGKGVGPVLEPAEFESSVRFIDRDAFYVEGSPFPDCCGARINAYGPDDVEDTVSLNDCCEYLSEKLNLIVVNNKKQKLLATLAVKADFEPIGSYTYQKQRYTIYAQGLRRKTVVRKSSRRKKAA